MLKWWGYSRLWCATWFRCSLVRACSSLELGEDWKHLKTVHVDWVWITTMFNSEALVFERREIDWCDKLMFGVQMVPKILKYSKNYLYWLNLVMKRDTRNCMLIEVDSEVPNEWLYVIEVGVKVILGWLAYWSAIKISKNWFWRYSVVKGCIVSTYCWLFISADVE